MKKLLPVIVLVVICAASCFGQTAPLPGMTPQQKASYEKMINSVEHPPAYYTLSEANKWRYDIGMIKARSLKTKGWILVAAGAVLGGAGFLIPNKGSDYTKPAFFGVGAAAIGTGIVCFSIAKKRKQQVSLILTNPTPAAGTGSTSFFQTLAGFRLSL